MTLCKVCNSDHREEINKFLIEGRLSLRELERKYRSLGIGYSSLRSHKENHLKPLVKEALEEKTLATKKAALETLDVLDSIIAQTPEVLESASLNAILKALELRMRFLGEGQIPPQIIVSWGIALEPEYLERLGIKKVESNYQVLDTPTITPSMVEAEDEDEEEDEG
jgi:hypothetical protein